ncbi:FAD binding domain protein [Xylariaceae sp. FL0662B]|nr:FAD binding domain protein [Xylariaceae sp. FL0662B]
MFLSLKISLAALQTLTLLQLTVANQPKSNCRCIPGDACWPNSQAWSKLNATIGGRLIATTPLASVCHDPHYNETACSALKAAWAAPKTHYPYPAEFMAPLWQTQSCNPFTPKSGHCDLGNYVDYSINVSSPADAAAGLRFAQQNNIRVVIKNTGHDYLGKSTGKGALGLWTHNLKSLDFFRYLSKAYTGSAVKIGAGAQAFEIYTAAAAHGVRVVGGECSTVGLAGGYLQGGGHSALSSTYGMGSDQTLEWEVVTADGKHLVASPTQNADLYWALSGGGGGTYGVVISVTVKTFKEGVVGGAGLSFNKTGISDKTFWEAITEFHASLPAIVDTGATIVYSLTNTSFEITPLTSPGSSKDKVSALLQPFLSKLKKLGVPVTLSVTSFPTYFEHFAHYLGPFPEGNPIINIVDVSLGGRLIPRSVVQNASSNAAFTEAMKLSVHPGGGFVTGGVALNAAHSVAGNKPSSNAVLPAWRDTIVQVLAFAPWDFAGAVAANKAADNYLLDATVPALTALAPDGGAYLNEANYQQKDWQKSFYGDNYDRLTRVKKTYDPQDLFFANTAVGSEAWVPDSDGRLCRSSKK